MINIDSQRNIFPNSIRNQPRVQEPEINKYLNILDALESGIEELDCELLRHFIDENLQLETIYAKKPGKNIAYESIISILFELLMSQSEHDSEETMNIFREGINKRKDFKRSVCGRGGILRRSAQTHIDEDVALHSRQIIKEQKLRRIHLKLQTQQLERTELEITIQKRTQKNIYYSRRNSLLPQISLQMENQKLSKRYCTVRMDRLADA
ncbi:MAG: hypothetical protein EZS28_003513 [Streblomastix strix]|uniref:Uncharacterized protein n=1 Tax=Streblomastix strix TaxID=222440 RepID=A0A5J4X1B5_9EUKA|nr:MAG: hypothetical protein EZS28_003513 [Streblomastix strix]